MRTARDAGLTHTPAARSARAGGARVVGRRSDKPKLENAVNSEELKNRAESILSARANGVKLSDIAERYGISPQRAHQIAKQASGINRVRTRDDMNGIE
jgi:hypothetical protein